MPVLDYFDVGHNLPTAAEIRTKWCFGLPLFAKQATQWTAAGQVMADTDIQSYILSAIKEVERRIGVFLKPTIIKNQYTAYQNNLVEGVDYDDLEPAYDYNYDQFNNWGFMETRQYPFLTIEGYRLALPNGQKILDFGDPALGGLPPNPTSWVKVYPKQGQVQLVPYTGISSVFYVGGGTAGAGALSILGNMWTRDLPQCLWLDYTAGFAKNKVPEDVRNIVAKIAACDVLGIAGEAYLAGISSQSIGLDGLSQSFSTTASAENTTYGSHVRQYQKDVLEFFNEGGGGGTTQNGGARTRYKGFTMTVL